MRRKSRTILLVLLLAVMFLSGTQVLAVIQKVYDQAELFSVSQKEDLQRKAEELSESLKLDMIIVTIDDSKGKTSREYADDFYDENGFGYGEKADGVLLLIDMANREIYISTCGKGINYLTDARIESILDSIYPHLTNESYSDGAMAFLSSVEYYVQQGLPTKQYTQEPAQLPKDEQSQLPVETEFRRANRILIYLMIAFTIGGISVIVMAANNKGVSSTHANTYLQNNSFNLLDRQDRHINTRVTHTTINTNSGGSSSSTTHRSSSGRSHGGGGRKF